MPGPRVRTGERVTLRTVESVDVPFLHRGVTNPEIRRPMGSRVMDRERFEEHLEASDADRFLVCLDGDDAGPGRPDGDADDVERIGEATVEDADWKRPEVTYWLVPDARGQGYGREAVSLVVDYVFRAYDAPAVGAGAYAFNDASRGLLESLGFRQEGRIRAYIFVDGEHRDLIQYGIRREEWSAGSGSSEDGVAGEGE
jgi:RimJ/RimL family protein N-acetyltransferase